MKKTLSVIIKDWAAVNKKIFWKYEVSSFQGTYTISVKNLPCPAKEDVKVLPNMKLIDNDQKTQLCSTIQKACAEAGTLTISSIDVKVHYASGAVTAAVV